MEERFTTSKNYVLRKIAGRHVLVAVGQEIADFCGVVTLNETAKVLWEKLQNGATKTELVTALIEAFDVTEEQAKEDVETTVNLLQERGMVTNV